MYCNCMIFFRKKKTIQKKAKPAQAAPQERILTAEGWRRKALKRAKRAK